MTGAALSPAAEPSADVPSRGSRVDRRLLVTRLVLVGMTTTASFLGLLPAVLYVGRGTLTVPALIYVAVFAVVTAFRITPLHYIRPGFAEYVAAGLSAISQGGLLSLVALFSWAGVHGLHALASWIAAFFDYSLPFGWQWPARAVAIFMGVVTIPGVAVLTTKGLMQALYPPVAGYRPFRRYTRSFWTRALLLVGLALAIAFTVLAFTMPVQRVGLGTTIIITLVITGITGDIWQKSQTATTPRVFTSSEEAIGAMFRALDFQVVDHPRTGRAEVDPYLVDLDYVASDVDRAFAIMVKEMKPGDNDVISDVSHVALAARALSRAFNLDEASGVEPVLVYLGDAIAPDLDEFARRQEVRIVMVHDPEDLQIQDVAEQARKGRELFRSVLEPSVDLRPQPAAPGVGAEFSLSRSNRGYPSP